MADLLSKITKRTVVNVCITTEEPVHVGSGKDAGVSSVDLPIVRDAAGKPVIPGSSIKGMFRAHFSRIVGSLDDASMNALNIRRTAGNLKDIEKEFLKGSRENREEIIEKSLGTIDKLFGISGLAAAIVFTDATVESKTVVTRKHVRIDPNTDRAMKGALFDLEAVPDMAKFKFTIVFDTITDEEHYGDVNKFVEDYLFKQLEAGMTMMIGGMKSRGYGRVSFKSQEKHTFTPAELLAGARGEKI